MNKEHEYTVTWEITVWATTPKIAAKEARNIQRDPNSIASIYLITDENGTGTMIDLLDE